MGDGEETGPEAASEETARLIARLRDSERRYRHLFDSSQDALYVGRLDRSLEDVNQAMVDLFGYDSKEEILAVDPNDLYPEPSARQAYLDRLFEEGSIKDYGVVLKARDGREIHILETANVIRDEAGEAVAYQGILRDVTEQRRLERQFILAQKMEAVGQLAGGIAHDFNNLLTIINGFSDLVLQQLEPDSPLAEDIGEVKSAAKRAADLTEQLLAFSRKQMQKPQVIDLNDVVQGFQQFLERTLGSDIEVDLDLDEGLAPVEADPGQLEQVLMNLAANAREAMPRGGRLNIRSWNERVEAGDRRQGVLLVPGDYSLLAIGDSGAGMDQTTGSRVFEPFFTTKGREKGTGLGLSTVYGIVKQNQGYIFADSEIGRGTRFTLYLPRAQDNRDLSTAGGSEPATAPGTETLLLVEDDAAVREFVRRGLEDDGYVVLAARDSIEARKVCDAHSREIGLLITDLVMPHGDGITLAKEITAAHPKIKALLISGHADRAFSNAGEDAAFSLLAKPFTAEELTRKVRGILDGE